MKIQDVQHGIEIDLSDAYQMKIGSLFEDRKKLSIIKRLLDFCIRSESLDEGIPLNFSVEEKQEGYLLITGNLIDAITALDKINFMSESCKRMVLPILQKDILYTIIKFSLMLPSYETSKFSDAIAKAILTKKVSHGSLPGCP